MQSKRFLRKDYLFLEKIFISIFLFLLLFSSFSESPIVFVVPWFLLNFLFITSLIVGVLGAVIPGRIVVRKNPVEILRRT